VTLAPLWDAVRVDAQEPSPRRGERVVIVGGEAGQHEALRQECGAAEVLPIDRCTITEEIRERLRGGVRIDHVVWILPEVRERADEGAGLVEDQEEGVLLGFRLIKALVQEGYGAGELGWTVITRRAQMVRRGEIFDAAHSSVVGLVGSMAKEYRNWKVRLIDAGPGVWPWREFLRLVRDERGDGWAWRDGQWYRRRLMPYEAGDGAGPGFKRGGVYVVIGGAGGVGQVLTEHLIRNHDARVVWIGRRQKDAGIERQQEELSAGGGERPLYIGRCAAARGPRTRVRRSERYGRLMA
jgi:polyketide synthase PksM